MESSFDQAFYKGEEITSEVIMKIKQEIAEGSVSNVYVMTVEGEGDSFCLELDEDDQGKVWISSLCDDFTLAAEIFEKWVLTGTLYSRPWRHQWKGKDGKNNYEIKNI